ncbi:MAG: hypothetical protein CMP76_07120 [Flavobacterium sp.]|uniref:hypothetical protein n=1 Tax=Flavobacterium sp. TaxID=239 RepID=UPI000C4AA28F|nr:hypothetical protein [Flavobacterium sp.]MBF03053.1 hypothetical protein [Flavobacterium sp.]
MKKVTYLFMALTLFMSCKEKTEEETTTVAQPNEEQIIEDDIASEATTVALLEKGCYTYNQNGNAIEMKITTIGDSVKGNLKIALAEKDGNEGTFAGTLQEDKLIGSYTFSSEGAVSKRDMAFLVKDNQLIEGYGEMIEGITFKNVDQLTYSSTMPLTKGDCLE